MKSSKDCSKSAFTLAEVLITLGIIGIVAAMTIPGLMTKINDKVIENQKKVLNAKIVQGLNMLNSQENGLTKPYANSEEFVRALSKYMKITTICGKDNISDCFGYENVHYYGGSFCNEEFLSGECEIKSLKWSSLDAMKLHLGKNFLEPAAFVMGDGSTVLVSWNSKCASGVEDAIVLDPDQPLKTIPNQCFDGLYDINGTSRSNLYTKDVLSFGRAVVGTSYNSNEIPGIGTVVDAGFVSYFGGAKSRCKELDMELPDTNTLKAICAKRSQYPGLFNGYYAQNTFWAADLPGFGSVSPGIDFNGNYYEYDAWGDVGFGQGVLCVSK